MKRLREIKEAEINDNENEKNTRFKVNLTILLLVLAIFGGIMFFTGMIGEFFGKTTENIVLCIIAVILAVMLYADKKKK